MSRPAARSSNLQGGHDKEECERIRNTTLFEMLCSNRPAVLRQDGAAQQDDGEASSQAYRTGAHRAPRRSCRRHGLRALTRQQTEQRELLERYNRLVHLDQLIQLKMQEAEKQMTSSGETEGPVSTTNMPAMSDDAQPTLKCKIPPRFETQRSRLWTIHEEEPVSVAPLHIRGITRSSETQRPTLVQLLRQLKEIQAKQDNQEHNNTKRMGALAKPKTKMLAANDEESGQYFKGHVTLKSLVTQVKGKEAILSLSNGHLSLVGGPELDQTLLRMPFSHVIFEPVPGHNNCIHFKTNKKKDNTTGVIIVLPSRSIRDEWLVASSRMDIKTENWHTTVTA